MKYQAHRGVASEYPENTMASFLAAKQQGYDIIELDVGFTKDHQFVTMHDNDINRTGRTIDGEEIRIKTPLSSLTYEELISNYEFGSWFSTKFKGEKAPLFKDVYEFSKRNNIRLKIDNKFEHYEPKSLIDEFLNIFDKDCDNITFSVIYKETAAKICKMFPRCSICFDAITKEEEIVEILDICKGHDVEIWLPTKSHLTTWWKKDFINEENAKLVNKYAKLGAWIFDNIEDYNKIKKYEPFAIETTGAVKPGM